MRFISWGAAGEVTGSQHLLQTDDYQLLLDCGLFQGGDWFQQSRNYRFEFDPGQLDAVFLTHAHIDHCGNLPALVKHGFTGPVYCSPVTAELTDVMLRDAYRIMQESWVMPATIRPADSAQAKSAASLPPAEERLLQPYQSEHVDQVVRQIQPLEMSVCHELSELLAVTFLESGHLPGASVVQLDIDDADEPRRLVFTGDLGRRDGLPRLQPATLGMCDILICEATYADRLHAAPAELLESVATIVNETVAGGGQIIVPAFALGRAQQLLHVFALLEQSDRIPRLPIYVDSPLSRRVQSVLDRHPEFELYEQPDQAVYIESRTESCELNTRRDPLVIIAASGMCEAGRIQHHLKRTLQHKQHAILLAGYQAAGTLGRQLAEGARQVSIHDTEIEVRASIHQLDGLSAHADRQDLEAWLAAIQADGGAMHGFAVHGESTALNQLHGMLEAICNESAQVAVRGQWYELD